MAKAITRYEANDGAVFDSLQKAEAHEAVVHEVSELAKLLVPRPDSCDYSNGHGYLQQPPVRVLDYQRSLVKIARRFFPGADSAYTRHFDYAESATQPVGMTMTGRFIDDGCPRPVGRAWWRLMCMDNQFREWGQPYYALNPDKAPNPKRIGE